jgi:nucleotide-binding universal stress UspA family protein
MLSTIIATDLSDASLFAVDSVVASGRDVFGPVTLLHVVDLDLYTAGGSVPGLLEFAEEQLAKEEARLRDCGIEAKVKVVLGDAVETIERVFAEAHADIVMLTSLGKGAAMGRVFGSTAEKLASRGAIPVLIERVILDRVGTACCRAGTSPVTGRILAAVGLDDASEHLARFVASLPGVQALRLVHVAPTEDDTPGADRALAELVAAIASSVALEATVVVGDPADAICAEAGRWDASLIAIASCAHGPTHRLVWGSVARSVAREAQMSVLIVPHPVV